MLNHIHSLPAILSSSLMFMVGCDTADRVRAAEFEANLAVQPLDFAALLDDVAIDHQPETCTVIAEADDGSEIGRFSLWASSAEPGIAHVAAEFADGGLAVDVDLLTGEVTVVETTLDAELVAERAEQMRILLLSTTARPHVHHLLSCAESCVFGVVAGCAPTGWWVPITCAAGAANVGCQCLKAAKGKARKPCGEESW